LFNQVWLNSQPLKLANLRGQVIVVDFWTFDCINCIHVTPTLREWYNKYQDKGLVIIGVHSPEFEYEKDLNNIRDAIARLGVPYPVAIDNDFRTWQAFRNQYWPTLYFIDKAGQIRHVHIGEGDYDQSEQIIRALLAESIS
jgi:thiol-disulfide isomerase/thioredoxin